MLLILNMNVWIFDGEGIGYMKKKLVKFGTSYGIIIPSTLLELMGADMKKLNSTMIEIDYDSVQKQIILKNITVIEE